MKDSGAKLVAKDAVLKLVDYLEEQCEMLTRKSVGFAKHAGRKKVMMSDISLAIKG